MSQEESKLDKHQQSTQHLKQENKTDLGSKQGNKVFSPRKLGFNPMEEQFLVSLSYSIIISTKINPSTISLL